MTDDSSFSGAEPFEAALRIERGHDDAGNDVLRVVGDLDLSTVPVLSAAVGQLVDGVTPRPLHLELSRIDFMDSSGIALLLQIANVASEMRLVNPSTAVRRVITMSGLETILVMTP